MKADTLTDLWKDRNFLRCKLEILEAKLDRYEKETMTYPLTIISKEVYIE